MAGASVVRSPSSLSGPLFFSCLRPPPSFLGRPSPWAEAGGEASNRLARHLLRKRTDVAGLRDSLADVGDIDRVWKRDFPSFGDWRTMTSEPSGTYLAEISDDSRRVRGEHMARTLIDLTQKGERVFAVVGSGHVIRLEWILEEGLS